MGSLCRIGSSGDAALAMGGDAGDAGISQVSSILRTLSPTDMDPPRVELSEPAPALGAPGAVVRVSGIGLCASPVEMFIGGNACEGAEAMGTGEIECTVPRGEGTGLLVSTFLLLFSFLSFPFFSFPFLGWGAWSTAHVVEFLFASLVVLT
jgi:hypothetical protein